MNQPRIESYSSTLITISRLGLLLIGLNAEWTSAQLLSEFQSSKDPVTDIFGLAQVLKRSNENPGSQLTTVSSNNNPFTLIIIYYILHEYGQ